MSDYEHKHDVIMRYCQKISDTYDDCLKHCDIEPLCSECYGNFKSRPDLLEQAYKRVYGIPSDDPVNHPSHYTQGNIECIDAMVSAFGKEAVSNFCICNAFKYIFRCNHKGGHEDLDKAVWYIQKFKELTPNGNMGENQ